MKRMLLVLVAAVLAAGCASSEDLSALRADVGKVQTDVTAIRATKADKAEVEKLGQTVAQVTADQKATAGLLKKTADGLQAVTTLGSVLSQRADKAAADIAGLRTDLTATQKDVTDHTQRLGALEKQVRGVRTIATSAHQAAGVLSHNAGLGPNYDTWPFVLRPFPLARLNDKGEFTACAEVSADMKKVIAEVKKRADGKTWEVGPVSGFASTQPFRKDGKVIGNSDELNKQCAELRAKAVTKELGVDEKLASWYGPTDQYGGADANRAVLVVLKRKQSAPAPPAAGQAQPPPAGQAPTTGQPGQQTPPAGTPPAKSPVPAPPAQPPAPPAKAPAPPAKIP